MYIKNRMTANPYTVGPEATVTEVLDMMKEKNISRVPVVKNGMLVGIITKHRLLEVSPSPATTLSVFEINSLLSKTKISEVMIKDVITVTPDTLIETAAVIMRDNDIGGLPVVDNGKLVGIITVTDLFDSFLEIMGYRDTGSRIAILAENDQPGTLAEVSAIIAAHNINITHLVIYRNEIIIRVNTLNIEEMLEELKAKGYKLLSVNKTR